MPKQVKVFYPSAKDEDEYLEVAARLGQLSALMVYVDRTRMTERDLKDSSAYLTARRIYDVFSIFAREHNRDGLYLTQQELKGEMRDFSNLEDGINYLLGKGLIREELRDIR
jgi:hypothetical protein